MAMDKLRIREATRADRDALFALLPQLADFEIPAQRDPHQLWEGDGELLDQILSGTVSSSFVDVAESVNSESKILGFVMVTLREEMLSHRPSAHLETIVVHPEAQGVGLGRRLMSHTEQKVKTLGAESLTLHVFRANHRARALYEKQGFDSELIRAVKWL